MFLGARSTWTLEVFKRRSSSIIVSIKAARTLAMHSFVWAAALGAVLATPVVVIATLLGALVFQALNPAATQLSSLARQKRLGPRRRKGVMSGRVSGHITGDFVVFIIGAHMNSLTAFFAYKKMGDLMQGMLGELARAPEDVGFLGGMQNTGFIVQYWRSADHLNAWARKPSALHFPTWIEFNKVRARTRSKAIGIWHESYQVKADQYENIYSECQPVGMLLAADEVVPASGSRATAAGRAGLKTLIDVPAEVPQVDDGGLLLNGHNKEE